MLWTPVSRAYFSILELETNALFGLLGHHARLGVDSSGAYILYPDIFPFYPLERGLKIPMLQSIAIHFNLIVIAALLAATPRIPYPRRIKGFAVAVALLSILHTLHSYYISYLFIWDYVDFRRWPPELPNESLHLLFENVGQWFPRTAQPYVQRLYNYWNHFLREGSALLIWLYFASPYLGFGRTHPRPQG